MSVLPRVFFPNKDKPLFHLDTRPSRIIGKGEMAGLVRDFDWRKTSLGRIESWSDTLITAVNLLLASRHPMFLWWGRDLIQFYNDDYRRSIGTDKHPSALGQLGPECWPEIWGIIGPQIEEVMERGISTWNIDQLVPIRRDGKMEEVYWTYSYSPVWNDDGCVEGTLVVCSETTDYVLSQRRLRALLAINEDSTGPSGTPESRTLLSLAGSILKTLDERPADFPFAAFYLLRHGQIVRVGNTLSAGAMSDPSLWPLIEVSQSQTPELVKDLQKRFGDIICEPWPEPVTQAYVIPLQIPGASVQAILVVGISPRLPFDNSYQTFFQLSGNRIAALLQSEIHRLDLAEAAERFSSLAKANPFGTVIGSLEGELNYANPAFLQTSGYSADEVAAGKVHWDDLTPPQYAEADAKAVEELRTLGKCEVYEKAYTARDGRHVPILLGAATLNSPGHDTEIASFITDLTPLKNAQEALRTANEELQARVAQRTAALEAEVLERKHAEMNLREVTGRLLQTQDQERRHMARELHDHAGQTLVALTMNYSSLLEAAKDANPRIIALVEESRALSDDLSKEIRTLSYLLHPPLLDEMGLGSALRWFVEGFSKRSRIAVTLELPEDLGRLPKDLELVVFRVVQESLTNVHRHSGSTSAKICLTRSKAALYFEISDRGKGISAEIQEQMTTAQAGVGVRGMEERIRQFGGTLQIFSSQSGTIVAVNIPLPVD